MSLQPIYSIAALCHLQGIREVIICPGSRCAPLILAFVRHGGFTIRTFSDERSAAFIALGLAQQTGRPCVLICTSGTAVYNFSPAIAEAFFSQTPVLVLAADRPSEWIGQLDGQTIYQENIFGPHVKRAYRLPQQYDHADDQWMVNRTLNEALQLLQTTPSGPVYINVPLREPLYPAPGETLAATPSPRIIENVYPTKRPEWTGHDINTAWTTYHNILVIGGQSRADAPLQQALDTFSKQHTVPVIGDILSNLHGCGRIIRRADAFLGQASDDVKKSLRPDLLITFGKSIISKNLKLFLRRYAPQAHWHIQDDDQPVADTYQHLTRVIRTAPTVFFNTLAAQAQPESFEAQKQRNFYKFWEIEERRATRALETFFPQNPFGEFEVVKEILAHLPEQTTLHLANSMSVRYANLIALSPRHTAVSVYANRGTSGIDGCTSTTVGHSLATDNLQVLITGDQAFFYDRNAFWHNYALPNLRVVLLNNHGGAIFRMIDGPRNQAECDDYFVTRQPLTAAGLCKEWGLTHYTPTSRQTLKESLEAFFAPGEQAKILEIESTAAVSEKVFDHFKQHIKKSYEL